MTVPQAAPLTCPVPSLQQGQTCVCNYVYHDADEDRQERKQHVWSLLVLCSNFWILKEIKGFYCAHFHL